MRLVIVGNSGGAAVLPCTVPDDVDHLIAFTVVKSSTGIVGGAISSDPGTSFGSIMNGDSKGFICAADTIFPPIPVSAGETLMVVFELAGTAAIYFDKLVQLN